MEQKPIGQSEFLVCISFFTVFGVDDEQHRAEVIAILRRNELGFEEALVADMVQKIKDAPIYRRYTV